MNIVPNITIITHYYDLMTKALDTFSSHLDKKKDPKALRGEYLFNYNFYNIAIC